MVSTRCGDLQRPLAGFLPLYVLQVRELPSIRGNGRTWPCQNLGTPHVIDQLNEILRSEDISVFG